MKSVKIFVEGGTGLGMLREDDLAIVNHVSPEVRGIVSAGLFCLEKWSVSEFFNNTGSIRVQVLNNRWPAQLEDQIEGESHAVRKAAAAKCMRAVKRVLHEAEDLGLGKWKRGAFQINS